MAKQNSFDIVSQVDMAEVKNAVNQATKELIQRFDLKGSNSSIELNDKDGKLVLASADEFKLNAVTASCSRSWFAVACHSKRSPTARSTRRRMDPCARP